MASSTPLAVALVGLFVLVAGGALLVLQPGAPVVAHQLPPVPGSAVPGASTVALPLVIDGPLTAPTRVRVVSPVSQGVTLVELDAEPAGTRLLVAGAPVLTTSVASPLTVQGDVVHDPVVTFAFAGPAGSVAVRVDRGTAPATVRITGLPAPAGEQVVQAPLAVQGPLTSPSDVAVYDVATPAAAQGTAPPGALPGPTLLLRYHDNGDGTASITYADPLNASAPTTLTAQQQLLVLDGSPTGDAWRVIVKDASGRPVVQFSVPLAAVRGALAANGVDTGPVLNVVRNALPGSNAYKAASDGARTLDPANLTGQAFLDGLQPLRIDVDVQQATDLASPMVRLSAPGLAEQSLGTRRAGPQDGWVRYVADVPAGWLAKVPDGGTVSFSVVYRVVDAKVVTDQFADDNDGQGYRFRVDTAAPGAPAVQAALDPLHAGVLHVTWSADDASSGVGAYRVQKGRVGNGSAVVWEDWVRGSPQGEADFAGEPGKAYRFRVNATDRVGHTGPAGTSDAVLLPAPADGRAAQNHAPTIQLLRPTGGESFAGVPAVQVQWRASDPDGTVPVINLYVSDDGGATWRDLASPPGTGYAWDVRQLRPGDYRLKAEATDGSLSDSDASGKFHVDNTGLATADSLGGPGAQQSLQPGGTPAQGPGPAGVAAEGGGMVVTGFAAVLVLAGAALAVWKWRAR